MVGGGGQKVLNPPKRTYESGVVITIGESERLCRLTMDVGSDC